MAGQTANQEPTYAPWRTAKVEIGDLTQRRNDAEAHSGDELRSELDDQVDDVLARLEAGAGRAVEGEIKALLQDNPHYHTTHFAMGVYLAVALNKLNQGK